MPAVSQHPRAAQAVTRREVLPQSHRMSLKLSAGGVVEMMERGRKAQPSRFGERLRRIRSVALISKLVANP
jgi:hypothetical protein